jgi:hypothetical protein
MGKTHALPHFRTRIKDFLDLGQRNATGVATSTRQSSKSFFGSFFQKELLSTPVSF